MTMWRRQRIQGLIQSQPMFRHRSQPSEQSAILDSLEPQLAVGATLLVRLGHRLLVLVLLEAAATAAEVPRRHRQRLAREPQGLRLALVREVARRQAESLERRQ